MKKTLASSLSVFLLSLGLTACFDSESAKTTATSESAAKVENTMVENSAESAKADNASTDKATAETVSASEVNQTTEATEPEAKTELVTEKVENTAAEAQTDVKAETKADVKSEAKAENTVMPTADKKPAVKADSTTASSDKPAHKKVKKHSKSAYSAEEIRLGLDNSRPLSAEEIEYQKYTCRYHFASPEEAKKYHCVVVRSVVR